MSSLPSLSCFGCLHNQPNQLAHMDFGGCLYIDDLVAFTAPEQPQKQQHQKQNTHLYFDVDGNEISRDEFLIQNSEPWKLRLPIGIQIQTLEELRNLLQAFCSIYEFSSTPPSLGLSSAKKEEILGHPLVRLDSELSYNIRMFL